MQNNIENSNIDGLMEKINIGVLMLDSTTGKILFQNSYFSDLTGEYSLFVVEHILESIRSKKKFKIHNDIEIDEKLKFGFSIYPIKTNKTKSIILVSNISSKKIYMDSKCRKDYYDKLSKYSLEIAHEVGNPLTSVIMTLQVLSKNLQNWNYELQKEYISTSIIELKRLSNFMKKLRTLSKNYDLNIRTINLKEIIDRLIFQNKARLDKKNIRIIERIDKDIRTNIDEEAFFQIVFNLIQNSIEILCDNSTISFVIEEVDEFFVKLVYSNNGPHIPEQILEKIFRPNFSTKDGGSGIGLNLSQKLITNMGGTITAENCRDKVGVRFILYIPVSEVEANNGLISLTT